MPGFKALPPAQDVRDGPYDLLPSKAPSLTGLPLRLFISVLEAPLLFSSVTSKLFRMNGYPQVLGEVFIPEEPTYRPHTAGWAEEAGDALLTLEPSLSAPQRAAAAAAAVSGYGPQGGSSAAPPSRNDNDGASSSEAPEPPSSAGPSARRPRAADFHRAYLSGRVTPSQVAENVIAAIEESERQDPPMRFLIAFDPDHIRQQAAASTQRYAAGAPLSPLDGVPFAVKDCVDVPPFPTTSGTASMPEWRQPTGTNPGVQALLDAGAFLIGKSNLHEIGLGTTGLNTIHGTPRNPHDVWRHTGGSSSGSGALVAAGLCPFALGSDGGGSIRIPAGLCGCVGLKTTANRVSSAHTPPIDQTVAVLGPLAGSVEDCLLMYAVMANTGHPPDQQPPALRLPRSLLPGGISGGLPLQGQRAGIYWKWFEDAEPAVVEVCRAAVAALERLGLEVGGVTIPELEALRVAHTCTITSEMRNNMSGVLMDPAMRSRLNLETRTSLAVAAGFTAAHYVQAQKVRTRAEVHFRRVFEEGRCDFILTPTLPCVAPPINPAALASGASDITTTITLMRFMQAANMLGLPAISVPVGAVPTPRAAGGKGAKGSASPASDTVPLPVGLQLMARPWHEASLLFAAAALEAELGEAAVPLPAVRYDVLRAGPAQQA